MIKELIMYTILCDNCTLNVMDNFEYSGFGDIATVKEICDDSGWHREDDKHYCPNCYSIGDNDELIIYNGKDDDDDN